MVDDGIFATTAEINRKSGNNASATSSAEAYTNQFITEAESEINVATTFNWSDDYAALNVDVKGILKMAATNLAAISVINYDHAAVGLREAESRITVLRDSYLRQLGILRDKLAETFINGET